MAVQNEIRFLLAFEVHHRVADFFLSPFLWVSRCLLKQMMMEVVVTTGSLEL